jgi:hypothetical protein
MSELGLPYRGKIWYGELSSYTSEPTDGDVTEKPISCKVQNVRFSLADKHKPLRDIGSPNACHLLEQTDDVTIHLEYIPQCDDTLLADSVNRNAYGKLTPLWFSITTNHNVEGAADKSYYIAYGCKAKTIRVSASINSEYIVAIDYSVRSGTTDSSALGTEPAALTGDYLAFNVGGSIRKDGADIAYILNSVDITIDQHLIDKNDHDSFVKQYAVEGAIDIEATVDISLDEGGGNHFYEVLSQKEFDIVVDLGGSGCPRINLPNCKWKSTEIDISLTDEPMMDSAPVTSKPTDGDIQTIISATP